MTRRLTAWLGLMAAVTGWASPARAAWVDDNCAPNHRDISVWTRSDSRAYALVAVGEGYEWGGGCWNDNGMDDTPTDSDSDSDGGEGPDCSGFTFKTWRLRPTKGEQGGRWYGPLEDVHGPYASADYRNPRSRSWPFHLVAAPRKDRLLSMDAYAKVGHVGLIYTLQPSTNEDYIIEAYGKPAAPPTGIFLRDYFGQRPTYMPVRREGWTPDCFPRCTGPGAGGATTVVVP